MSKTKSLPELLSVRLAARENGETVVHCHGCFDIVHPGHIKHLQYARSLGDRLVVSISADTHVNKGVARPLIPDDLRAASVAALECVDWVYINPDPTAVELLGELQPDVYVKGKEYERNNDPRFLAERDAVTQHGGRVVFSSGDIVYSSTSLIGTLGGAEVFNDEKITRLRDRYSLSDGNLHQLIQRFRGQKVVVVGDYILDRYHFCDATGLASEGPMMSLRALQQTDYDGGAGVIALHLAGLGASPTLVTSLADDDASRQISLRLRGAGVDVRSVDNRKSIVSKQRFLVDHQKMFKVDDGGAQPLDSTAETAMAETILEAAEGAAAVIFADFGYGAITGGLLDRVLVKLRAMVPTISADVSGKQTNLRRFRDVDLVGPTERELRETLNDFSNGLGAVVWNLMNETGIGQAMITMGKQGLVTFDHPETAGGAPQKGARLRSEYVPALSSGPAIDPLGCGDALLATATLTLAVGGNLQAAALLGSIAASIAVSRIGNRPIELETLIERIGRGGEVARLAS